MSISERIVYIQQQEGLSASKFADLLGVQRSGLSHIYSGRNKPSIDFLQKLSTQFPNYRLEWILNGVEPIFKTQNKTINSTQKDLFDDLPVNTLKSENPSPYGLNNMQEKKTSLPKNTLPQDTNNDSKEISEILIVYNDNTFKILRPSNDK